MSLAQLIDGDSKPAAGSPEQVVSPGFPNAFLTGIPPQFVATIFGIAQAKEYSPGRCLFAEGDPPTEFLIVQQGHVRLEMAVPGRGKVNLLTVGPGEILAWSALLSHGKLTATGTALDSVRILSIPGPALRQLCEQNTELGYHVMKHLAVSLSQRLLATRLQLLDLFSSHEPRPFPAASVTAVDPEC